jgi:WXG100 family type VII secretion target
MPSDSDLIRYNYQALEETVREMLSANGRIQEQMTDLENQVQQNKELFLGASSDQYGVAANVIHNDLTQSTDSLHRVATSVATGSGDMQDQDRKLANLF